ncbi:uncharacterized protein LOC129145398 [Talpa occidentalis]|uniref:uncharacterized protein LOC129145398 n=1 Tax=Talpa occidentalis TaxID=50954 RepID=UPI0023F9F394|nr:uncharacterized protein LOC129145398 [Talpa occidentalis]
MLLCFWGVLGPSALGLAMLGLSCARKHFQDRNSACVQVVHSTLLPQACFSSGCALLPLRSAGEGRLLFGCSQSSANQCGQGCLTHLPSPGPWLLASASLLPLPGPEPLQRPPLGARGAQLRRCTLAVRGLCAAWNPVSEEVPGPHSLPWPGSSHQPSPGAKPDLPVSSSSSSRHQLRPSCPLTFLRSMIRVLCACSGSGDVCTWSVGRICTREHVLSHSPHQRETGLSGKAVVIVAPFISGSGVRVDPVGGPDGGSQNRCHAREDAAHPQASMVGHLGSSPSAPACRARAGEVHLSRLFWDTLLSVWPFPPKCPWPEHRQRELSRC